MDNQFVGVPGASQEAFNALNNKYVWDAKQPSASTSVPANSFANVTVDITKSGYTPKMATCDSPWNEGLIVAYVTISGNEAACAIYNTTSSAKNARPKLNVMYEKN